MLLVSKEATQCVSSITFTETNPYSYEYLDSSPSIGNLLPGKGSSDPSLFRNVSWLAVGTPDQSSDSLYADAWFIALLLRSGLSRNSPKLREIWRVYPTPSREERTTWGPVPELN